MHDDAGHKIVVNENGIHSLIIFSTAGFDAGQYICIARNRGGEDRFTVHLNVVRKYIRLQKSFKMFQNTFLTFYFDTKVEVLLLYSYFRLKSSTTLYLYTRSIGIYKGIYQQFTTIA